MQFFTWLRTHPLSKATFAILPRDGDEDALRTTTEAVDGFMFWPSHPREFEFRLSRVFGSLPADVESIRSRLNVEFGMVQIGGKDDVFIRAVERIPLMAATDAPVLITGETGVGKELCARAIHHLSARRAAPFIPMDCGALPEGLIENELYGHSRGAFTGAHTKQRGLVASGIDCVILTSGSRRDWFLLAADQRRTTFIGKHAGTRANYNPALDGLLYLVHSGRLRFKLSRIVLKQEVIHGYTIYEQSSKGISIARRHSGSGKR